MSKYFHTPAYDEIKEESNGQEKLYNFVPWFSWNEWDEVYQKIYSSEDRNQLQLAYDQIMVWKSRVERIAVGIEATLPLLQAKIALSESSMDTPYQNSLLTLAIVKFVSIILKGYQNQNQIKRNLFSMAEKINMPFFLVSLRNEIIHSDTIFGDLPSLKSALNISLQWIKEYYWEVEHRKIYNRYNGQQSYMEKIRKKSEFKQELPLIKEENNLIAKLERSVTVYTKSLIKRRSIGLQKFISSFEEAYPKLPNESMKILVRTLFHKYLLKKFSSTPSKSVKSKCHCRVVPEVSADLIEAFEPLVKYIWEENHISCFILELIKLFEGRKRVCQSWLEVIFNTLLGTKYKTCLIHRYSFKPKPTLTPEEWKKIILSLFELQTIFTNKLALKLSHSCDVEFSDHQKKLLTKFVKSCIGAKNKIEDSDSKGNDDAMEMVFSKEDCLSSYQESRKTFAPLGYLPHQRPNPNFNNSLILYCPE